MRIDRSASPRRVWLRANFAHRTRWILQKFRAKDRIFPAPIPSDSFGARCRGVPSPSSPARGANAIFYPIVMYKTLFARKTPLTVFEIDRAETRRQSYIVNHVLNVFFQNLSNDRLKSSSLAKLVLKNSFPPIRFCVILTFDRITMDRIMRYNSRLIHFYRTKAKKTKYARTRLLHSTTLSSLCKCKIRDSRKTFGIGCSQLCRIWHSSASPNPRTIYIIIM